MYLSNSALRWAIRELQRQSHPFVGISFLACKKERFPVGDVKGVSLDAITRSHLEEHHRLDPQSLHYFQPFKSTSRWVSPRYASSGLQGTNTRTFRDVFIHQKNRKRWGFQPNYVTRIRDIVRDSQGGHDRVPIPAVAIWIGKERAWPASTTPQTLLETFISDHGITAEELQALFSPVDYPESCGSLLSRKRPNIRSVAHEFGQPPDAPSEARGTLTSLHLRDIGPAARFDLDFGERLTLITGDNGLGKTFLLDTTWWALTANWANRQATPIIDGQRRSPSIRFRVRHQGKSKTISSHFDRERRTWRDGSRGKPPVSALCLYARLDGSIAVSDEARRGLLAHGPSTPDVFSRSEIWDSKPGEIEGLVRDWATWQMTQDREGDRGAFYTLVRVLEHLSSEDLGPLVPGEPQRILGDPRMIPTIRFPYGDVPILMSSAGVQRILALAYIVAWAWHEHVIASEQTGKDPLQKMVILVDEVEAHLHPRWQRAILPALMTVGKLLSGSLRMQVIAATHSPLVVASVETEFSSASDVLYHLALNGGDVTLESVEYHKYGDSSAWLTSPVFGLRHARSKDAEKAIEEAKAVQLDAVADAETVRRLSAELRRCLGPDDPFWPRWMYFAERLGGNDA